MLAVEAKKRRGPRAGCQNPENFDITQVDWEFSSLKREFYSLYRPPHSS